MGSSQSSQSLLQNQLVATNPRGSKMVDICFRMPRLIGSNCFVTAFISKGSCSTFHNTPRALLIGRLSRSKSNGWETPRKLRPPIDRRSLSLRASWDVSSSEDRHFRRSSMSKSLRTAPTASSLQVALLSMAVLFINSLYHLGSNLHQRS